jgi:hypothetical protein
MSRVMMLPSRVQVSLLFVTPAPLDMMFPAAPSQADRAESRCACAPHVERPAIRPAGEFAAASP